VNLQPNSAYLLGPVYHNAFGVIGSIALFNQVHLSYSPFRYC